MCGWHFNNLKREDLQPLVDSLLSRMAGWRGKLLSSESKKNPHPNYFIAFPYICCLYLDFQNGP
jgi:hypothetical protein